MSFVPSLKAKDSSNYMRLDGLLKSFEGGGWSFGRPLHFHLPENHESSAPSERSKIAKMPSIIFLYLLSEKFVWNILSSIFQQ